MTLPSHLLSLLKLKNCPEKYEHRAEGKNSLVECEERLNQCFASFKFQHSLSPFKSTSSSGEHGSKQVEMERTKYRESITIRRKKVSIRIGTHVTRIVDDHRVTDTFACSIHVDSICSGNWEKGSKKSFTRAIVSQSGGDQGDSK